METIFNQKVFSADTLFDDYYIEGKMLYIYLFNALPCLADVGRIDGEKACKAFRDRYAADIKEEYSNTWYESTRKQRSMNRVILVLKNRIVMVFGSNYAECYHDGTDTVLLENFTAIASTFRKRSRRQPSEINLIVPHDGGLSLRSMEFKKTRMDLDLYYEEEFKAVDVEIQRRLSKRKDKGIVLLHGLPGTGKTSYLRHLIGRIKKRVMFVSPGVAGSLMNPEFLELMVDNPDTVLIIEDAENIIMDRRQHTGSGVSNLLNMSDGLLADCLNIQLVCTFNSSLTLIDQALLRPGRLIARYEFDKLSISKAQRLSDHLGFIRIVNRPMTIAEISQPDDSPGKKEKESGIGFRRSVFITA